MRWSPRKAYFQAETPYNIRNINILREENSNFTSNKLLLSSGINRNSVYTYSASFFKQEWVPLSANSKERYIK